MTIVKLRLANIDESLRISFLLLLNVTIIELSLDAVIVSDSSTFLLILRLV
jgi:hypothetical protein